MKHPILWALYALAVLIELMFDTSKFVLVHSIVLAIIIKGAVMSIDWQEVNQTRNRIGGYFVYA